MSKLLSRESSTKTVKLLITAGIILFAVSLFSWWNMVYTSPSKVFNRMIATSLSTSSVTKTVVQSDDSQKLVQTSALTTKPIQQVHARSVLSQVADSKTAITTESIGTPTLDFVRYTDIKTSEKTADNKNFDFSKVINIWGKSVAGDQQGAGAQLYNQTLLGVIPVANVPQPSRKQLVNEIIQAKVFKIEPGSIKKLKSNGRPVYNYDVTVQPVPYVTMLKSFARALGLKQLEQVDPSQYADSEPLKFTISVDAWSSQLTNIAYKDSPRTEALSGHGARTIVGIPGSSIPVNELQTRLQQIR